VRVRTPEVAQDLVQEAFLAALRSYVKFAGRSSERSWLFGILKNKIVDYYRKLGRETSFTDMESLSNENSEKFVDGWWIHVDGPKDWKPEADVMTGLRVLVVDDNATNREIMSRYARSWNMRATCASGGEEALKLLRDSAVDDPYELIVLDMQMPEMDGLMLAREITKDAHIPTAHMVMLTSLGNDFDAEVLKAAGIAACVLKPVQRTRLLSRLIEVMAGPVQERAEQIAATGRLPKKYRLTPEKQEEIRIMVAEDNRVNQMVALNFLQKLGYRAKLAINGREVLKVLEETPYDLILMDCQMPEMDGYEATRQIRAGGGRQPRIVAMTANAMTGDEELCRAAGMDDYLSKPVHIDKLKEVIERWLPK
jgi:two-component system, sensor histidine kinase and response regulator